MTLPINHLYKTQIDASTYEPTIDSTDTVITVTLIDFRGNPVTNKAVTVTCDWGFFNKNINTNTNLSTSTNDIKTNVTSTTDSNGQLKLQYTACDWDFIDISANNTSIKLYVSGWRNITLVSCPDTDMNDNCNSTRGHFTKDAFTSKTYSYDDSICCGKLNLSYNKNFMSSSSAFALSTGQFDDFLDITYSSWTYDMSYRGVFINNGLDSAMPGYILPSVGVRDPWYRADIVVAFTSEGSVQMRGQNGGEKPDTANIRMEWQYLKFNGID